MREGEEGGRVSRRRRRRKRSLKRVDKLLQGCEWIRQTGDWFGQPPGNFIFFFAFVGALSNSLDQTLIVLLIFMLIQNLNLEVALLFFVVCENQAFRSGWVRLPVEVSAGGVRWEDIPEQCSLTWCK